MSRFSLIFSCVFIVGMSFAEVVFARCAPRPAIPVGWRIENNPTVTVHYRVRGRVTKCVHQIWEELASHPFDARVVDQPRNGHSWFNSSFKALVFEWKEPISGNSWRGRVCGEMHGQKGCVTINFVYAYQ